MIWKAIKRKKPSITRDYVIFSCIVALLIIILCAGFTRYVYLTHIQERYYRIAEEAEVIESTLNESFDYMSYLLQFIGKQISYQERYDKKTIAKILKIPVSDSKVRSLLSWTGFDWVNPEGFITITSTNGILKTPVDLRMRTYSDAVKETPWKLILGDLAFGRTSAQWIISSAMGVTAPRGKFIGSISLGFDIQELARRIESNTTKNHFSYVILNNSADPVLHSLHDEKELIVNPNILGESNYRLLHLEGVSGKLPTPIQQQGTTYTYYKKLSNFPYTIIMGYNDQANAIAFSQKLFPLILAFSSVGFIFLILLHIFAKRIITPITALSHIADKIAKGEEDITFPRSSNYEVFNLTLQISKIKRYIKRIKRIKKSDSAKSEILAHVSHELRTPLNAIINFSEIQRKELYGAMGNSKYVEYAEDIHNSGKHLLQLIDNVLDLSKAEANKITLYEEALDLNIIALNCIRTLRVRAEEQGVELQYCHQEGLPLLYADEMRIKQILLNLLTNAIKFSDAGTTTTLFLYTENNRICMKVEDKGIGIPESDLNKVMEKFGQVNSPYHRSRGGTGLGLPLTKGLVELHKGTLTLQSDIKLGTTVTIRFPEERTVLQPVTTNEERRSYG